MTHTFLLIGEIKETHWPLVLERALSSLGKLIVISEEQVNQTLTERGYDVIIIDAGAVENAAALVSCLRLKRPESRIIVATASPTWQRAREMLKAGASDYIRKSQNEKKLQGEIQAVLEGATPC
jgi:DNA-binding NarL/FixJ family response regulator